MRVPKQKGVMPHEAIKELYPDGSLGGHGDNAREALLKLTDTADRCLTEKQLAVLKSEGAIRSDENVVGYLLDTSICGSDCAGEAFAVKKAVEILQLCRLKCADCVKNKDCPSSDWVESYHLNFFSHTVLTFPRTFISTMMCAFLGLIASRKSANMTSVTASWKIFRSRKALM
jgi:hypothetical protein